MKLALNPVVSFSSSNLIEQYKQEKQNVVSQPVTAPQNSVEPLTQQQKDKILQDVNNAIADGKDINTVIESKYWDKKYIPEADVVLARIPGSYDGLEYTIHSNGKVVAQSGWGQPKIVNEADEKLAKYFEQIKNAEVKDAATFTKEEKTPTDNDLNKNVADFKSTIKNSKWEKTYLPESDVIWVEQKRSTDSISYCIEKDGTVKKTDSSSGKSEIIMEANKEISEVFNNIKAKETKPKKSFSYKVRDAIGDTWKFFSVTGTMTMATAKGVVYGTGTALGVLGSAVLLKLMTNIKNYKEILKNPLKSAGTTGKILAGVAGGLVLASYIVAGKLQANEETAIIEHKMKTDHRDD